MKIINFFVITILIVMYTNCYSQEDVQNEFRKTSWGITKAKVKEAETAKILKETEKELKYEYTLANLKCNIVYLFVNDKLISGSYVITEDHKSKNTYIENFETLKSKLQKKYNEPTKSETVWKNMRYKGDKVNWGHAISVDQLYYYTNWEFPKTKIEIKLSGKDEIVNLVIKYISIELENYEQQLKEQESLDDF
ncbi:MAG: hypothetical protein KAT68_13650 [Bacteroidales bacterium]|nr:hypothetical protein [Bacteroidales bacterium]